MPAQKKRLQAITEEHDDHLARTNLTSKPTSSLFTLNQSGTKQPSSHHLVSVREDALVKQQRKSKKRPPLPLRKPPPPPAAPPRAVTPDDIWAPDAPPLSSKVRHIHAKQQRPKHVPAVPVPHPGSSYNPTAQAHVDALAALATTQSRILARRPPPKSKQQQEPVAASQPESESAASSDGDDNDDSPSSPSKPVPPKTRAERARLSLHRQRLAAQAEREADKRLARQAENLRSTVQALEASETARAEQRLAERERKRARAESTPTVRVNGRRIETTKYILPEVLPPSQLPERLSSVPGVPGIVAEHFRHMQGRNLFEAGKASLRGVRRKAKMHKRGLPVLDLDQHVSRVPEPHFAPPKRSQGPYGAKKRR